MRNNVNSIWTEALVANLVRLWDHGYSCSQIGAILGVTRNAVIGKAHRLELPSRAGNVNSQKRAIDPLPPETPRTPTQHRRPRTTVFKSREIKPSFRAPNPKAKPALMTAISMFTGKYTGAIKVRRPGIGEMSKDQLRAMLTAAVQTTAAMEVVQ
jgi:hypothetical protein